MGCPTWTLSAIKWMEYFADLLFYWTFIGIFVLIMVNPSLLLVFPAPMVIGAALFVSVVLKIFTSITILCGLHESWGLFTSMLIYFLIFLGLAAVVLKTKAPIIMEYASPTKMKELTEKISTCLLQEGASSMTDIVNQQTNAIANNVNQQANAVANNALQQTNALGQSLAQPIAAANNAALQANAAGQSFAQPMPQITINVPQAK